MYGVGEHSGDRSAEYTYRDLARAQWEDYKNRFLPRQEELMNAVTSTQMLDEQLGRISATSKVTGDAARQTAEMMRGRYGMQQTDAQRQAFDAGSAISGALGQANAQNMARQAAYDRYQSSMTGAGIRPLENKGSTGGASGS